MVGLLSQAIHTYVIVCAYRGQYSRISSTVEQLLDAFCVAHRARCHKRCVAIRVLIVGIGAEFKEYCYGARRVEARSCV